MQRIIISRNDNIPKEILLNSNKDIKKFYYFFETVNIMYLNVLTLFEHSCSNINVFYKILKSYIE